jgi:hypothetical protein
VPAALLMYAPTGDPAQVHGPVSRAFATLLHPLLGSTVFVEHRHWFALAWVIFAGMLLPTSLEYRNATVWGGELGASLRGQATSWLTWHGGVAFPVVGAVAAAGSQARASATAAAGASWTPAAWFRLTLEIDARLPFGKPVEQVAAGLGLRFAAGRLGIELDGLLPFAGTSRFDVAALLRATWRLDGG